MPHEKEEVIKDLLKQVWGMNVVVHNPTGVAGDKDAIGNGGPNFAGQRKFDKRDDYLKAGQEIYTQLQKLTTPRKHNVGGESSTTKHYGLNCQGCSGLLGYMLEQKHIPFEIIYIGIGIIAGHVLIRLQQTVEQKVEEYYLDYWMARIRSNKDVTVLAEAFGPWGDYEKIMSAVAKGFYKRNAGKVIA